MPPPSFYRPTPRGLEGKIGEKLAHLRELDDKAKTDTHHRGTETQRKDRQ
jgi:hypothetical protein